MTPSAERALNNAKALVMAIGCILVVVPLVLAIIWLTPIAIIAIVGTILFFFIKSVLAAKTEEEDSS
tara:strand:+ start:259 stop:459 length:201 start_codon:yes stop_codon:yes gene_type:complete